MDKKSAAAIRRLLKPETGVVDRLYSCYYDGSGDVFMMQAKSRLMTISEASQELYHGILRKSLSGKIGKNLYNLSFPLQEEEEGGMQHMLYTLLKDPSEPAIKAFFEKVIDIYQFSGRALVILAHGTYDVPYRAKDGVVLEDSSETVYEFFICSFCPVSNVSEGLEYDPKEVFFTDRDGYVASKPEAGFLFPAFNDRSSDIHSVLYYTRKPSEMHPELITELLGCPLPETEDGQKEAFRRLITEGLGDKCTLENVSGVYDGIREYAEESREEDIQTELGPVQIERIFRENGADTDVMKGFSDAFEDIVGRGRTLAAENITDAGKIVVKAPGYTVNVGSGYSGALRTRRENDMEYLVLPLTDATVNGVPVR